jgi:hypothetical protein
MLSQEILAICLYFSEGDINTDCATILQRITEFQTLYNCHYGISQNDIWGMFVMLFRNELNIIEPKHTLDSFSDILTASFQGIKLKDVILPILDFDEVYCNDEGEHWLKNSLDYYQLCFEGNQEQYMQKMKLKENLQGFFTSEILFSLLQEDIQKKLLEFGITKEFVLQCSRTGFSS